MVSHIGDLIRELTFWYKIDAASMPWVAFAQALAGQRAAAQSAVLNDGLLRIFRTTRIKAAMLS